MAFWRLHDADAAVQLTLGVVVVDVGVAAAHVGRQVAGVVGTAVLKEDVGALLASGAAGVRQRRLTTSIPALHVHAVLSRKEGESKSFIFISPESSYGSYGRPHEKTENLMNKIYSH